jgi:hypothetical protein
MKAWFLITLAHNSAASSARLAMPQERRSHGAEFMESEIGANERLYEAFEKSSSLSGKGEANGIVPYWAQVALVLQCNIMFLFRFVTSPA